MRLVDPRLRPRRGEKLHAFYGDGSWTREDFAEKHILFQDDRGTSGYDYIAAVFGSKES